MAPSRAVTSSGTRRPTRTAVRLGTHSGPLRRHFTTPRTGITNANTIVYRASQHDCGRCALKPQCCPNATHRKITRSLHEATRDVARDIAKTAVYRQSRRDRKKVEMLFAHLKRVLKLGRLRLCGLCGTSDEFTLTAIAQNLRRRAMRHGAAPSLLHSQAAPA